jgi:hypothetical protein
LGKRSLDILESGQISKFLKQALRNYRREIYFCKTKSTTVWCPPKLGQAVKG